MADSPNRKASSSHEGAQAKATREIAVTIVCAILVAATSVVSALLARQTISKYEVREVAALAATTATDYFPLRVGNYWKYSGKTRCLRQDGTIQESSIEITMAVIDTIADKDNPDVTLFIMQGHPSDAVDLGQSTTGAMPKRPATSPYGYLVVSNKVFHIGADGLEAARGALEQGGLMKESLLPYVELVLELPLFRGQRFGELGQLPRNDFLNYWYVNEVTTWHSRSGQKLVALPEYELTYATLPDGTSVGFLPYLGFTFYRYGHHGTKSEAEVNLVEYEVHTE